MNRYVLDACALIAFLNREEGADEVENILLEDCSCLMSVINVYEVCYDAAKVSGIQEGINLYQEIKQLPIEIVREIEEEVIKEAIYFKAAYKISVADSMALGLAKVSRAAVVTADHHEFDMIDQAKELEFCWIR